jgi:hypothetical protein
MTPCEIQHLNGRVSASVLQSACFLQADMRLMAPGRCDSENIRCSPDKQSISRLCCFLLLSSMIVCTSYAQSPDDAGETRAPPALASADEMPVATTDSAVYIDQLIDPFAIEADSLYPDFEDAAEPEGFRSYSTEYRHYQQDIDQAGKSYEDGLIFHARRETRDYGEFELLATVRSDRPSDDSADDDTTGGRLTLRQYGFALNENWLLDNSAGVLRSDSDQVLSNSYRFNLPSTLVSGLKNWSRNEHTQLRFSVSKGDP